MGWKLLAVVHVVHAVEVEALAAVDLQNHLVGQFHPGLVVANRRGRHQGAVFQHSRDFNQGDIELAVKTEPCVLRHMGQVNISILHGAFIDFLATHRIGLIGQAHFNAVDLGQCAVKFGCSGSTCPNANAKRLATRMCSLDALGQLQRDRLGVTRSGKTAHTHVIARHDLGRSSFGRHDFFSKQRVHDAGNLFHGIWILV